MSRLTIRAQNTLWIIPLFLVLSGASGWISYESIKSELIWSFEQEAESLAIAISELVDRDQITAMVDFREGDLEAIAKPLRRLRRWGQIHRVSLHTSKGDLVYSYGGLQTNRDDRAAMTGEQKAQLATHSDQPVWVESLGRHQAEKAVSWFSRTVLRRSGSPAQAGGSDKTEGALLSAFAPIRARPAQASEDGLSGCSKLTGPPNLARRRIETTDQPILAWIRIETNVDEFVEQDRLFRSKVWIQMILSALLGMALVVLLTRLVAPGLDKLTKAAGRVTKGRFEHDLETGSVREINDLATTFGTMVSVLGETVAKGRRSVMDREESRANAEIAETWAHEHLVPKALDLGRFEVAATLGSEAPMRSFLALFSWPDPAQRPAAEAAPAGFLAAIGSVDGDDPVTVAAAATAVPAFLEEHCDRFSPEQLLAETRTHFGVSSAKLVVWNASDDRIRHLTLTAGGAVESRDLEPAELDQAGLLEQEDAGSSSAATLATLTRWVAPFDAERLLIQLQRFVARARRGGAFFIRTRKSNAG